MSRWQAYWYGPTVSARFALMMRAVYLVLGLDVLATHLGPAWRYGAAGFNVPHFAWMEALPTPTREVYVGALFVVGLIALTAATLETIPRALRAVVALVYLWSWSCSMHDSYQHHYLISLVLGVFVAFPTTGLRAQSSDTQAWPLRERSFGHAMASTLVASVYVFTAVSKLEPDWRNGDALRAITQDGATMDWAIRFAARWGLERDEALTMLGASMAPLQLAIAGVLLAVPWLDLHDPPIDRVADRAAWLAKSGPSVFFVSLGAGVVVGGVFGLAFFASVGAAVYCAVLVGLGVAMATAGEAGRSLWLGSGHWWGRWLRWVGLVLMLSFHIGAEFLALEIGWFSFYMIVIAWTLLSPPTWPALFADGLARFSRAGSPTRAVTFLGLAVGCLAWLGFSAGVPGAGPACLLVGVGLIASVIASLQSSRVDFATASAWGRGVAFASLMLIFVLGTTRSRFDFHRFAGGDFRRRLEYAAALESYEAANRFAPPGESRVDRVAEMRALLEDRHGEPAAD